MEILIINSEYPPLGGGASHASENIASTLVQKGHSVRVITAWHPSLQKDEERDGVSIHRVFTRRKNIDRSGAFEQAFFMISGLAAALRTASRKRPDVVLAFFGIPGGAVALGLKLFTRIPYIVSLRGGDVPGFRPYDFAVYHKIMGPLIHLVWRHASVVVANSQGLKDIATRFDASNPIEVIPNGINSARFYPTERERAPARLLFVGRLVYQKGGDVLIDALANIKSLDWELTIVGDGPRKQDWVNQAARLGISERLHFPGWLDKSDLLEQYQKANIFVLPSRHEGMPNVVLEAMGCGLPVIATRIAGSEDLVLDGTTGYLIEPDDPQELSEALVRLIAHKEDIQRMGEASRTRVIESFSWDSVTERYLTLLSRARNA